jgi:hypothetical protein
MYAYFSFIIDLSYKFVEDLPNDRACRVEKQKMIDKEYKKVEEEAACIRISDGLFLLASEKCVCGCFEGRKYSICIEIFVDVDFLHIFINFFNKMNGQML